MSIIEEGRFDRNTLKSQGNIAVMMIIDDCSVSV